MTDYTDWMRTDIRFEDVKKDQLVRVSDAADGGSVLSTVTGTVRLVVDDLLVVVPDGLEPGSVTDYFFYEDEITSIELLTEPASNVSKATCALTALAGH